jgi:hypothetical protein
VSDIIQLNPVMVGLPRRKKLGVLQAFAVSSADDSDVSRSESQSSAVGVYIRQSCCEIRVPSIARSKQMDDNPANNFYRVLQHVTGVNQDVLPPLDIALIQAHVFTLRGSNGVFRNVVQ